MLMTKSLSFSPFIALRLNLRSLCFSMMLVALGVLMPGTGVSAQETGFHDVPAHLRPGDVLAIQVWRQPEYSGEFEVTSEGTIAHPLFRNLYVLNRDISVIEAELRTFLRTLFEDPALVLEAYFQVAVGGEVRGPDVYALRPGTSVARAIALAGGPTERGNMERVMIRRAGATYLLDLAAPETRLRDLEIRSGDEIIVERKRDLFRDVIAPSASVISAVGWLLTIILR
jgi:protein involved in polysaccharide export with SLBB domain